MRVPFIALLSFIAVTSIACNQATTSSSPSSATTQTGAPEKVSVGKAIASAKSGAITVTIANPSGRFKEGENDFTVEFTDQQGKTVDIGASTIWFEMPAMGSMAAMKSNVKLITTATPGVYQANAKLEMAGTWTAHVKFKGAAGEGHMEVTIQAS